MAATPSDIANYLLTITDAQSDYGYKVSKHFRLGRKDLKNEMIKLIVLGYCVRILEKYFDCTDYTANNFFTEDEATEIMRKINNICKTFIYLDI